MWFSPFYLEEFSRERSRDLSQHVSRCRLAEEFEGRPAARWRRFLARRLASLSLHIDDRAALAALEARFSLH